MVLGGGVKLRGNRHWVQDFGADSLDPEIESVPNYL